MTPSRQRSAVVLLASIALLVAIGLVAMASASQPIGLRKHADAFHFLKRQVCWLAIGGTLAWIAARIPHRWWRTGAYPLAALALALLVAVLLYGPKINGARRWLFSAQPSEFARFALIVLLARYLTDAPLRMARLREGILIPGAMVVVPFGLVIAEPDVGGAVQFAAVAGVMMFLAGCSMAWLSRLLIGLMIVVSIYVALDPHRAERVRMWWQNDRASALAWQSDQTERAFARGHLTGAGLGHGTIKRRIPEAHTDYVLAVIAEEMGLLGTMSLAGLFFAVTWSSLIIVRGITNDRFGQLLGYGLVASLSIQALLNVAVVTGIFPPKGVPLPLVSYGGSSYLIMLLQSGILLGLCRTREFLAGDRLLVETAAPAPDAPPHALRSSATRRRDHCARIAQIVPE